MKKLEIGDSKGDPRGGKRKNGFFCSIFLKLKNFVISQTTCGNNQNGLKY